MEEIKLEKKVFAVLLIICLVLHLKLSDMALYAPNVTENFKGVNYDGHKKNFNFNDYISMFNSVY